MKWWSWALVGLACAGTVGELDAGRGSEDAGVRDAGGADSGSSDAGALDAGALVDAGAFDASGAFVVADFESGAAMLSQPNCAGTGTAAFEAGVAHSGARALHVVGAAGYCNHVFARWSLAGVSSTFWLRVWVRAASALGAEHVTILAMQDTNDGAKDLRLGGQAGIVMFNRESDDATLPALSPTGIAATRALVPNTWTCLEVGIDQAAGTITTRLDGAPISGLMVDAVSTPDLDEQWKRKVWLPRLADLRLGYESYGNGSNELWFDDLVVGPDSPGCR